MRALLARAGFRRLWLSHVVSTFGDSLTALALLLTAQRLTGSTAAVATTAIAIALPQLLFGLFSGVLVDRWDRRRIMVFSDLVRAGLVLGFIAITSADLMWLLYLIAFIQATVGTLDNPARAAVLPQMVRESTDGNQQAAGSDLLAANSLFQSSAIVAGVLGTGTAGLVAGLAATMTPLFVLDAVTYVISSILVARLLVQKTVGTASGQPASRIWLELRSGLRLVTSSRSLRTVLVGAGVVMLGLGAVNVLLVPFIVDDLAVPETWFGLLEAAQVSSMVLAGLLVAALSKRLRPGALLPTGLAGIAVFVASMSLASNVWHLIGLLFAVGWFVSPTQGAVSAIIQSEVPTESLGRASASLGTVITTAQVVSMALSGVAAELFGLRTVFVIAGVITFLAAAVTYQGQRMSKVPVPSPS
ncbi:MAG TPA: MFS transporter [Acidimicrobiia bacterium]|nr:MFS transporter [Acidimicrobiia bacterium]